MSTQTLKYTVTVYNDSRLFDGQQQIHTWVELSDGLNPPNISVYSFGPTEGSSFNSLRSEGHFDKADSAHVSQARKDVCDKITINLSYDQYRDMIYYIGAVCTQVFNKQKVSNNKLL